MLNAWLKLHLILLCPESDTNMTKSMILQVGNAEEVERQDRDWLLENPIGYCAPGAAHEPDSEEMWWENFVTLVVLNLK
jgi:hypothetical protein